MANDGYQWKLNQSSIHGIVAAWGRKVRGHSRTAASVAPGRAPLIASAACTRTGNIDGIVSALLWWAPTASQTMRFSLYLRRIST